MPGKAETSKTGNVPRSKHSQNGGMGAYEMRKGFSDNPRTPKPLGPSHVRYPQVKRAQDGTRQNAKK